MESGSYFIDKIIRNINMKMDWNRMCGQKVISTKRKWNKNKGDGVTSVSTCCMVPSSSRNMHVINSIWQQKTLHFLALLSPGFFLPTGRMKLPPSGSGEPDWFDRFPEKTDQIQIPNQKRQFNRFPPVSRPFRSLNRSSLSGNRDVKQKNRR